MGCIQALATERETDTMNRTPSTRRIRRITLAALLLGAAYAIAPAWAASSTDFIECPIEQKPVRQGANPDIDLFKKLIRCKKGEKAVAKGDEGAVAVDVGAIQIGAPRPWSYSQDIGNGQPGTAVYPVKATYTVRTFYRAATEVEENWIRILNFHINSFGEWQIGSEEPFRSPKVKRIPNG